MSLSCIVLAGGLGARLRPVVNDVPKCLAPVGNRTFLEIQLRTLHKHGLSSFVLALGFGAPQVIDTISALKLPFEISVVVEPIALGTGGAILNAFVEKELSEALVVNGDTYLSAPLESILSRSLSIQEEVRIGVIHSEDRSRFGGLDVVGECVTEFHEKGVSTPGLMNAGVYRLKRSAFNALEFPVRNFSFERDLLPTLVGRHRVGAAILNGAFTDIGSPHDYYRFVSEHSSASSSSE